VSVTSKTVASYKIFDMYI